MSTALPDLSDMSPEDQQNLFALSTEESRQERLAKQRAQAQALMSAQSDASQYRTPLAGLFGGLGDAVKNVSGGLKAHAVDQQAQAMDAAHVKALQDLMAQRNLATLGGVAGTGHLNSAQSAISGVAPDVAATGMGDFGQAQQPSQQQLIASLLMKRQPPQDEDTPDSHDFSMGA